MGALLRVALSLGCLYCLTWSGFAQSLTISTVAGNGIVGFTGDCVQATSANINSRGGIVVDRSGNLYMSDLSARSVVRKVTSAGVISTVAGNGTSGFSGDGGPATSAQLNVPRGLAL